MIGIIVRALFQKVIELRWLHAGIIGVVPNLVVVVGSKPPQNKPLVAVDRPGRTGKVDFTASGV